MSELYQDFVSKMNKLEVHCNSLQNELNQMNLRFKKLWDTIESTHKEMDILKGKLSDYDIWQKRLNEMWLEK